MGRDTGESDVSSFFFLFVILLGSYQTDILSMFFRFTKSQKRASILLSDVSQSIVSALISPSHLSAPSRSATASKPQQENPFTTNAFYDPLESPSPCHLVNAESTNKTEVPVVSTSLLDDLDIGEVDEAFKLGMGSSLLVPDPAASNKNTLDPSTKLEIKVGLDKDVIVPGLSPSNSVDDEDWNW